MPQVRIESYIRSDGVKIAAHVRNLPYKSTTTAYADTKRIGTELGATLKSKLGSATIARSPTGVMTGKLAFDPVEVAKAVAAYMTPTQTAAKVAIQAPGAVGDAAQQATQGIEPLSPNAQMMRTAAIGGAILGGSAILGVAGGAAALKAAATVAPVAIATMPSVTMPGAGVAAATSAAAVQTTGSLGKLAINRRAHGR